MIKKTYVLITETLSQNVKLDHILAIFFSLLLCFKLSSYAISLFPTLGSKAVIFSKDNDAGRAIQTAELSRWYNSNHFAPYGNLYFRLAHTFAKLGPQLTDPDWSSKENEERTHHFALLMVSLFSLTLLCWFLVKNLTPILWQSIGLTNVLLYLALQDAVWSRLILKAHPDHLLMLTIAVASASLLRYTRSRSQQDFVMAALLWGLATAVKRSTVLFAFSFVFIFFVEGLNRTQFKKGLNFLGLMLIAYFAVGFPQNFSIYKHVKFMLGESHNSRPPTLESIIEYLHLFFDQTKYLILAFISVHIFLGVRSNLVNWKFAVFTALAIVMTLSSRMVTVHYHHPMPAIACLLVFAMYLVKAMPVINFKFKKFIAFLLLLPALYFTRQIPSSFAEEAKATLECRTEILSLMEKIKNLQSKENLKLGRDPFFPFDSNKDNSFQYWGASMQDLDRDNIGLLGIMRSFGSQFLEEGPKYNMYERAANWHDKQILYRAVLETDSFITPKGNTYIKIHEDKCGYMLWKRNT